MEEKAERRAGPPPPPLVPGTLLGRYRILGSIGRSPYGEIYRAEDTRDGGERAVRIIRPQLVRTPASRATLAAEVARACTLEHPNIVKCLDYLEEAGEVAVISQLVPGRTLRAIMAARAGRFTVKDAQGILNQLCAALTYSAGITYHGGITASSIVVGANGQLRIAEFGLARALPPTPDLVEPPDRPALAPELPNADTRADLYALGAIAFEILTGRTPAPGVLPRQLKPELPAGVNAVVSCLLAESPDERFPNAETLRQAFARAIHDDAKARASKQQAAVAPAPHHPHHRPRRKSRKMKVHVDHHEARWLVHKGKLDYGPYTLHELKEKIEKDEVVPGDIVIDQELSTRAEAEQHPLLHDLVHAAAQRRDDARRVHVEATVERHDTRHGMVLYSLIGIGALILAGAAYVGVGYLRIGSKASTQRATADVETADLSRLKIGGARHVDDREAQRRHRSAGHPAAGTPSHKGSDTFDDALSFDMVDPEVGDERLDDDQINGVLTRNGGGLGRCLQAEAQRGGARQANIDFIVLGSGKVSQVRVNGETGSPLASCVRSTMQAMQFPTFNGPRTKASFPMTL